MATHLLRSQIAFVAAGQFAAVIQHWFVVDPTETNLYRLARLLINGFDAPDVGDPYYEAVCAILSQDTFVSSARSQVLKPATGTSAVKLFANDLFPGSVASDLHSQQVASTTIWVSSADDGLTGRNFWPGVPESFVNDGVFTDAANTAAQDLCDRTVAGIQMTGNHFLPAIYDRTAGTWKAITQGYLTPSPGTIRKRLKPI